MTHLTTREIIRLVMVAFGAVSSLVALIWSFSLLSARAERGLVEIHSGLEHGEMTNVAYVVWGHGMHLRLEPGELSTPLKAGESVTVLAFGKGGTLRFGRSFWREWRSVGAFVVTGVALVIGGLYVLRPDQSNSHQIEIAQPV
jgi:hypothetical protein